MRGRWNTILTSNCQSTCERLGKNNRKYWMEKGPFRRAAEGPMGQNKMLCVAVLALSFFVFWPQTIFLVNRLSARRQRFVFVLRGKASLPSCRRGTHKKAEHLCNTICGRKGLFSFLNFLFLSFLTNEKSFKQLADSTRWGCGIDFKDSRNIWMRPQEVDILSSWSPSRLNCLTPYRFHLIILSQN